MVCWVTAFNFYANFIKWIFHCAKKNNFFIFTISFYRYVVQAITEIIWIVFFPLASKNIEFTRYRCNVKQCYPLDSVSAYWVRISHIFQLFNYFTMIMRMKSFSTHSIRFKDTKHSFHFKSFSRKISINECSKYDKLYYRVLWSTYQILFAPYHNDVTSYALFFLSSLDKSGMKEYIFFFHFMTRV